MMVQIYGLPPNVKSYDIKTLIKKECNISEIILDHFVDDVNGSKNIKVGLSTDEEGYRVINCLDGFRFSNQFVIKVEQVGKGSTNRYERNQYGTQSYGSQVSEGYGSGQYAPDLRGQTNPPRQYSGQTDKLASGGFGRNQNMPNQRQWNNEPPPQPRPNVYPSQTNRRNRSPEALPTSFLNEMLHNLKNSRPLQGDEPRTSEFRRQSPPRYPNRPVSPARKPRYVPPNERPSSIRQKGQNWGEPPRYDGNIPQKTQQQRFPPAGDNDRFPTYSADNKNLRYLPSQHSDSSQDKYMGNSQQTAKMPAPFQAPESNPPMYSGGYQHNQKGNSSFLTPAPVRQTPWQNDVKNIPDPNKFENNMPMQSGMRSRSPVRNEPSPIHEAGRTSPKRSWAKETRPQTLNRPAPFVWDDPNAQNNPQSVSAWDSGTFQGNPQRFNNAGNLVGSMQGNRQPGQQFASTSKETAVSQISPQRSDFRQSMDIGRSSDSYRPQFESVQSTSRYENRDENTRSAQESSRFGDHSSRQESNRYQYESDDTEKYSGSTWNSDDNRRSSRTDQTCNEKRDKAAEVIVKSLLQKHQHYITQYSNPDRNRVMRELKFELDRLFEDMFGDRDIPYIEIMIKYKAKFGDKDEEVLIENVLSKLADENRSAKRSVQEYTGIPSKAPRYSQESTNADRKRYLPSLDRGKPMFSKRYNYHNEEIKPKYKEVEKRAIVDRNFVKQKEERVYHRNLQSHKRESDGSDRNETVAKKAKTNEDTIPSNTSNTTPRGTMEITPAVLKVIDEELNDVMNSVKEITEKPDNDLECEMLETLQGGIKLRQILKQNVVKRLTRIFNPLYVKLQFTAPLPPKPMIVWFLKANNCVGFKKINEKHSYTSKVRTIEDFNRLCSVKNFNIGKSCMQVSSMHNFVKCTPKINEILKSVHKKMYETSKEKVSKDNNKNQSEINMNTKTELTSKVKTQSVSNENTQELRSHDIKLKPVDSKPFDSYNKSGETTVGNRTVRFNETPLNSGKSVNKYTKADNDSLKAKEICVAPNTKKSEEKNVKPKDSTHDTKLINSKSTDYQDRKTVHSEIRNKTPIKLESPKQKDIPVKSQQTVIKVGNKVIKINEPCNKNAVQSTISNNAKSSSTSHLTKPKELQRSQISEHKTTKSVDTKLKNDESSPMVIKVGNKVIKITEPSTSKSVKVAGEMKKSYSERKSLKTGNDYDELDDTEIEAVLSGNIVLEECEDFDNKVLKVKINDKQNESPDEELSDSEIQALLSKKIVFDNKNSKEKRTNVLKTPKLAGKYLQGGDNDELNDKEIQALLNESIVLDECSDGDIDLTEISTKTKVKIESETKKDIKKTISKKSEVKLPQTIKKEIKGNDDDELNDDEIQELLSQSIVLDECSDFDNTSTKAPTKRKAVIETEQCIKKTKVVTKTFTDNSKRVEKKPSPTDELNDDEIQALLSKGIVLDQCGETDITDSKMTDIKFEAKIPSTPIKTEANKSPKPERRSSDYNELKDNEIQALLSKGIVLDDDTNNDNSTKTTNRIKAKKVNISKTEISNKGKRKGSDYDELDDREIQELLSKGIVLDQCSDIDNAHSKTTNKSEAKNANIPKITSKSPKVKRKTSDHDELKDSEIQALLSKGIVLDQCDDSDIKDTISIKTSKKIEIKEPNIPKTNTRKSVKVNRKNSDYDELNDSEIQALLSKSTLLDQCGNSKAKETNTAKTNDRTEAKRPTEIYTNKSPKVKRRSSEYDELNDNEIQELLSQSIVLDECGDTDTKITKPNTKMIKKEIQNKQNNKKSEKTTNIQNPTGKNDNDELDDSEIQAILSKSIIIDECGDFNRKSTKVTKTQKSLEKHDNKKTNIKNIDSANRILEEGNSDDELDDNEIQALLSGAVIVDECSDSDN